MERVHRGLTRPVATSTTGGRNALAGLTPYLQAAPLTLVFAVFLLIPIAMLVIVSFFDYDSVQIIPAFILGNYRDVIFNATTWATYLETLKFVVMVWAITLFIGFWLAYFLAFHVRSRTVQTGLFLVCSVPFWTSNMIRMISWVPFLGRNGLANQALQGIGLTHQPLEFLLFSKFAVVLAFVHLDTVFMLVPIFNTMSRIDKRLVEAAIDNGANGWQVIANVIVPLCKPGIAIGSIFVVTLVMGDFITVQLMSGGQSASVGAMIQNEISLLQYPAACANAVVLLAVVLMIVAAILRVIDIRKEL
jgi:putative spermidine/putrescine transport system permease protein